MTLPRYKIKVEMIVEVEIDPSNGIVNEYDNYEKLLADLVSYQFSSVLPVRSAVKVDFEDVDFIILETNVFSLSS